MGLSLFSKAILICFAQSVPPSLLLLLTPKRSYIRPFYLIFSLCFAYEFFLLSKGISVSPVRYSKAGSQIFVAVIQATNVLVINPLDRDDLVRGGVITNSESIFAQTWHTSTSVFFALRGINTAWRVKNIPEHPKFLTEQAKPRIPRASFLVRQAFLLAWEYLVLDVLYFLSLQDDSPQVPLADFKYFNVGAAAWGQRVVVSLITWFWVARVLIDSIYRAGALVAVGLCGDAPEDWPPLFGSMWDAYTLRNFWGKFWHQFLRWPFTSMSNYITRDLLGLPRPSIIERYTNVLIVFLLSGWIHVMTDSMQGVPPSDSGAMVFFPLFTLGFMIEDGVQHIWKTWKVSSESGKSSTGPRLWQRVLGLVWVMAWISVTSPRYLVPTQLQPKENRWMVPISVVQWIGIPAGLAGIVAGGLMVMFGFGTEI